MTFSFLRSEFAFKAACIELRDAAFACRKNGHITPDGLYAFLLRQEEKWPSSEAVLFAATELASFFNKRGGKPTQCRCLQALAHAFTGEPYEKLLGYWRSELSQLFSNLQLPTPKLDEGIEVSHPYPRSLLPEIWLAPLKHLWERDNTSTSKRAFLPPIPPPAVFGLKEYGRYTIHRSWNPNEQRTLCNESLMVVFYGNSSTIQGAVRWSWWGHHFQGSDFTIYSRQERTWKQMSLDLRPYAELPTHGPIFWDLDDKNAEEEINNLIQSTRRTEEDDK